MIAKKSKKADLERKRFAFFQIGLLVAGSLCLAAFEYTTANYQEQMATVQFGDNDLFIDDVPQEIIEIVEPEKEIPLPKPVVFNLDTDTILIVDTDLKNLIVSNDKKIKFDDSDLNFDPNANIDLTIKGTGKEKEYEWVDKFPEFVGGEVAMSKWIGDNVKFPEMERQMGLGGVAYVSFVVEKDGSISSVTTLNENDDVRPAFLNEGKRVIGEMPNWIPGENMGKKVRVRFMVPINFTTN